jgi:ketosteroid isomerase-like protein
MPRNSVHNVMEASRPVGPNTDGEKMIENLHRQRVLNFLDTFSAGDIDGALSRCTDDVEFFSNAPIDILPHMGHHNGKAELKEMWETVHSRYSSLRYEVPILIAEGEQVAANIRAFFRKRRNERVVQFDIATFYTLRDGRISRIREIMDTFDLVEQLLERDVTAILAASHPDKT